MIRNVVFDMGQVLITWDAETLLRKLGVAEEDHEILAREVFRSVAWVRLDRGTYTEEQTVADILPKLPERLHWAVRELVCAWWKKHIYPTPGMGDLIHELKENGYGIYLLSNANLNLRTYFHKIPGSECFDGLLVSAEEKLLKPQHEIYERLCDRFDLKPEECFFVDDVPANIEGAACIGMHGAVFYKDVPRLRADLRAEGINCRAE